MKNPISLATSGLVLASASTQVEAYTHGARGVGQQRVNGHALGSSTGAQRIPFISPSPSPVSNIRRGGVHTHTMRDTITNTYRDYSVHRDTREMQPAFGMNMLVDEALDSTRNSVSNATVNPGTADVRTQSLEEIAHTGGKESSEEQVVLEDVSADTSAHHAHLSQQAQGTGHHHHSGINSGGHQSAFLPHHTTDPVGMHNDLFHHVSVRTGSTVEGKSAAPAVLVSGGVALLAMAGAAHGMEALDHLMMAKLQSWPAAYQLAAKVNEAAGALLNHMASTDMAHSLRHAITEMVKISNIETVMDPHDNSSFKLVKLNIKPVPGGPTFSLVLSAEESLEASTKALNEKNVSGAIDDMMTKGLQSKRKELTMEVPSGYFTLTLPEVEPPPPGQIGLSAPNPAPASLCFVDKQTGAEFVLTKVELPRLYYVSNVLKRLIFAITYGTK